MAQAEAVPQVASDEEVIGINAVLLGPPGSGKGTQIQMMRSVNLGIPFNRAYF